MKDLPGVGGLSEGDAMVSDRLMSCGQQATAIAKSDPLQYQVFDVSQKGFRLKLKNSFDQQQRQERASDNDKHSQQGNS